MVEYKRGGKKSVLYSWRVPLGQVRARDLAKMKSSNGDLGYFTGPWSGLDTAALLHM